MGCCTRRVATVSRKSKISILTSILGDFYKNGPECLFYCPRCEHHKKKLSVNIEKNVFKCWVCDWSGRNIYRLVRRYGSYEFRDEWKKHTDQIEIENFAEKLFGTEKRENKEIEVPLPKEFISLANKNLPSTSLYALNYLQSRGIIKSDIIRWKIGYCFDGLYEGRVVIPSFNLSGKANYFVARSYRPNNWKKYLNPQASRNIIFNHLYLDFDEDVTLVEGVFDSIVAGYNSIPLLGSTLREDHALFEEIVKNDSPVYIALDRDASKKELSIIKLLLKYDIEVYKIEIAPYSDVGEMSKVVFKQRKSEATFINSTNYMVRAISGIK